MKTISILLFAGMTFLASCSGEKTESSKEGDKKETTEEGEKFACNCEHHCKSAEECAKNCGESCSKE